MTKVLDNFHSPPMVMAPWVDYGNYPTLESLIEKKIIFIALFFSFLAHCEVVSHITIRHHQEGEIRNQQKIYEGSAAMA